MLFFFPSAIRPAVPQKESYLLALSQDGHVAEVFKSQLIIVKQWKPLFRVMLSPPLHPHLFPHPGDT